MGRGKKSVFTPLHLEAEMTHQRVHVEPEWPGLHMSTVMGPWRWLALEGPGLGHPCGSGSPVGPETPAALGTAAPSWKGGLGGPSLDSPSTLSFYG